MDAAKPAITTLPLFDLSEQLNSRLAQLGQEHCVFSWGQQLFAVTVSAAREVLLSENVTPVPQARPPLLGVLNLRGDVLPLLRLEELLDLPQPACRPDHQVLVLSCDGVDLGVIVDRVREVRPIDPKEISAAMPDGLPQHRLFKGCWLGPSGAVIVLDASDLIRTAVSIVTEGFHFRRHGGLGTIGRAELD
jgi:purine-binding chemotaxis protein CheW